MFIVIRQVGNRPGKPSMESLQNRLAQLRKLIEHYARTQNYTQTCSVSKTMCQKLLYFLKFVRIKCPSSEFCRHELRQAIKSILLIMKSTEYEKYTHFLPILSFAKKKYQTQHCGQVPSVDPQRVHECIHKCEQSQYFHEHRRQAISMADIYLSKTQQVLESGNFPESPSSNPACIGCSQVFIKNSPIENHNSWFRVVFGLTEHQCTNRYELSKSINGVCNSGGGVIIIGSKWENSADRYIGIRFTSKEDVQEMENIIFAAIHCCKPGFFYSLQRVRVQSEMGQTSINFGRPVQLCFRLFIFPLNMNRLHFSETKREATTIFEMFEAKHNPATNETRLVSLSAVEGKSQGLYERMHHNYRNPMRISVNSHTNIHCFCPLSFSIHNMPEIGLHSNKEKKVNKNNDSEQFSQDEFEVALRTPTFKYPRTCLLVVGCKSQVRDLELLKKKLEKKKLEIQISVPYEGQFRDEDMRTIWMLSHRIDIVELKKLAQVDKAGEKVSVIKILPVHKTLQVPYDKYTEYKESKLAKRINKKFKSQYLEEKGVVIGKNQEPEQVVYLKFEDYSESIYAYMVLEEMQIRPYFVKQGESYKKNKNKKGKPNL